MGLGIGVVSVYPNNQLLPHTMNLLKMNLRKMSQFLQVELCLILGTLTESAMIFPLVHCLSTICLIEDPMRQTIYGPPQSLIFPLVHCLSTICLIEDPMRQTICRPPQSLLQFLIYLILRVFGRYYSKTYPPEVRRALERNLNFMHIGGKEKRKRGDRGPNLCLNVWTMPEGARIRVSFNDQGQPIGDEARTLSSFLGQIARDGTVAPVTYTDWRFFPEKNKKAMMHLMNLKFELPPIGQIWSLNALGKKWKDWKGVLKHDRYDVYETDEERLADRDFRVPEDQWKVLVAYWGTEKAKAASARCKASQERHPQLKHPRIGSKSYARLHEEERQKRLNMVEPSLTDTSVPKDPDCRSMSMDGVSAEDVSPD